MTSEISAACTRCGNRQNVQIFNSINVDEHPEMKARVLDGSAFLWECPCCGTRNLLKYQCLYHDPSEKLLVWLTCSSKELEQSVTGLGDKAMEGFEGYTARFVDDAGSLIEKVKILDAGLDDPVMEMTKYVTKLELCGSRKDRAEELMQAPFKFLRMEGADNDLVLAYPLDGNMQMVEVGFNVYEDCRGILKRNPSMAAATKGFVKVDQDWVLKFFQ